MPAGVSDFSTIRDVPEDKSVTKDGDDAAVYSDDKLRVIIYPKVEVGSRLVVKANGGRPLTPSQ